VKVAVVDKSAGFADDKESEYHPRGIIIEFRGKVWPTYIVPGSKRAEGQSHERRMLCVIEGTLLDPGNIFFLQTPKQTW
jgi:hypothetical protein